MHSAVENLPRPSWRGGVAFGVGLWLALASFCLVTAASAMPPPIAAPGAGTHPWAIPVQSPAEPDGYRMGQYRAPTPATLRGALAVDTAAARALWDAGQTLFIDVLPRPPKPKDLPEGTVWRDRPRDNIPGSAWLPNVGFGALNPELEAYFRQSLATLTGGDPGKPLLIYCLTDCWMSWNAAKRALELGYRQVYWYPEGTDGWLAGGGRVEDSQPLAAPDN